MNWKLLLSAARQGQKNQVAVSSRSAFEQDFDRIIFSHPFRKLQDKTQVHPLPEQDFVHTRLTHSLEVSSVGRSLGRKAGEVIIQRHPELAETLSLFDFGAVTAAAALAHDLGNPPFGHAGEDALSDFFSQTDFGRSLQSDFPETEWTDLTKFEGNAQGFRILNSNAYGLHLTYATLGAFTKYPCASVLKNRDTKRKSQKKYGFYETEKEAFREMATHLGLTPAGADCWHRHPLAMLVEAADDICYNIIDLEDACRLGLVSFHETVELLAAILRDDYKPEKLDRIHDPNEKVAVLRALAINKLVDQCTEVFIDHENDILGGTFDSALADHCASKEVLDEISRMSVEKIYRARHVIEIEASGHEVLPGILHEFVVTGQFLFNAGKTTSAMPRKYQNASLLLPPETRFQIKQAQTFYQVLRAILDFVSGLTDRHAVSLFRKMKGISV